MSKYTLVQVLQREEVEGLSPFACRIFKEVADQYRSRNGQSKSLIKVEFDSNAREDAIKAVSQLQELTTNEDGVINPDANREPFKCFSSVSVLKTKPVVNVKLSDDMKFWLKARSTPSWLADEDKGRLGKYELPFYI